MPRPTKKRHIKNIPEIKFFKPAGIPMRQLEEVNLKMEEVEAIRLKDLKNLNQEECSKKMEVSRPTFQRILVSARQKIAEALIKGKGIRFKGGEYELEAGKYQCNNCGEVFKFNTGRGRHRHGRGPLPNENQTCPQCNSFSFKYINQGENK